MNQAELREWASKKRAGLILKHATPGTMVRYAGADYEVAHQKQFPHGRMVGIYDEPPGKHVDYINPRSLTIPPPFSARGGGELWGLIRQWEAEAAELAKDAEDAADGNRPQTEEWKWFAADIVAVKAGQLRRVLSEPRTKSVVEGDERAVAPGEAEALIRLFERRAAANWNLSDRFKDSLSKEEVERLRISAAIYEVCIRETKKVFGLLEPKPDSEVSDSERSGRRNVKDQRTPGA